MVDERRPSNAPSDVSVRVISYNIRYAIKKPKKGEEPWDVRKPRVVNELLFATRYCDETFICLQEVLDRQLQDVLIGLNGPGHRHNGGEPSREWSYVGVGRDDGRTSGEYSPIIFRPAVWKLERWRTVWLSETPDRPSKGWDAACIRILTVAVFSHVRSNRTVLIMNTHLDHAGPRSRYEAARMIVREVGREQNAADRPLPILMAGDFNSTDVDDAYRLLEADDSPVRDFRGCVRPERRYGNEETYTGFKSSVDPERIDFVFVGPRERALTEQEDPGASAQASPVMHPVGYGVLANRFDDGVYASDHRAVIADIRIE
ncbi:MAG: hypothetical protein M1815_005793 [Lichina confinis]|nr:MAG: hypothetical protein M1815_005793 [Lichina confinis]